MREQLKLTASSEEEQHQDPVDPEEQKCEEGDKGLQREEGEVDEDLPCYVEQRDGQGDPLTHEEHQQQQDHLEPKGPVGERVQGSAQTCTSSYREDGGGHSVDQQRLFAVPAELRLLPRILPGSERVVSREAVVDVEPPQDAGPR